MSEIIFLVEEHLKAGFSARTAGESILPRPNPSTICTNRSAMPSNATSTHQAAARSRGG
jgi:hypothetical protein